MRPPRKRKSTPNTIPSAARARRNPLRAGAAPRNAIATSQKLAFPRKKMPAGMSGMLPNCSSAITCGKKLKKKRLTFGFVRFEMNPRRNAALEPPENASGPRGATRVRNQRTPR